MTKTKRDIIPQGVRFDVLRRDEFTCQYCGRTSPSVILEIDHVVPVASGGTDNQENLITACFDCNRGKGVKDVALPARAPKPDGLVGLFGLKRGEDGSVIWRFIVEAMVNSDQCTLRVKQTQFERPQPVQLVPISDLTTQPYSLFSNEDDWIWTWALSEAKREGKGYRYAQDAFYIETERDYEAVA
jgi:hypothetical protein